MCTAIFAADVGRQTAITCAATGVFTKRQSLLTKEQNDKLLADAGSNAELTELADLHTNREATRAHV